MIIYKASTGPCTPTTSLNSISAELLGPEIKLIQEGILPFFCANLCIFSLACVKRGTIVLLGIIAKYFLGRRLTDLPLPLSLNKTTVPDSAKERSEKVTP